MTSINDLILADIMSTRVLALPPDHPLEEAVQAMAGGHVSCLVVMAERQPVGILTERDMVRLFASQRPPDTTIAQVMSAPALTVPANLDFRTAYHLLQDHGIRHLMVVDPAGAMLGIVSETDFRVHLGLDVFRKAQDLRAVMDPRLPALPPETSLASALDHMLAEKWDHVIVLEAGRAVGIVTERDVPRLLASHADAERETLASVMSSPVQSIPASGSVTEAAECMNREHLRHMVVTDDAGLAIGVLSQHRLLERLGDAILDQAWQHRQTADSAHRHAEQLLEAEHRFAHLLATEPERDVILQAMLAAALSLPELDAGGLLVQLPDGGYRLEHQEGLPASLRARIASLPADSSEAALLRQDRPLCNCLHTTPLCHKTDRLGSQAASAAGIRAIIALPIRVNERPGVCLYLASRQVDSLATDTVTALDTLAHQFSQALERLTAREQAAARQVALQHSEALLRTLVHTIPDLVWLKDTKGVYLACNLAFERFIGATEAAIVGKRDHDLVEPALADSFLAHDLAAMAADAPTRDEEWLAFAGDGYRGLFETVKTPMRDADGRLIGVLGIAHDITATRRIQEQLREERDRSSHYLDVVEAIVVALDGEGRVSLINRKGCDLLGYAAAELIGKNWFATCLPQPSGMDQVYPAFQEIIGGRLENKEYFENLVLTRSGESRLIAWHNAALHDEGGRTIGTLSAGEDITERRQAEAALQSLNRDFVSFLDNTTDFVYFKDAHSRFRFCSQTLATITGHANWRDMAGKHDLEVFPPDTAQIYCEEELPVFREGKPLLNKIDPYYDEQGEKHWVSTNKWPVFDAGGKVVGLFGISRDISELISAEAAVKASEEMLRTLIDAMPDIVCFKDGEGRWLLANDFDLKLFQLEGVDYRGKKDSELAAYSPFYHDAFMGCEATDEQAWLAGGPSRVDEVIPRPDGSERIFDVIKLPTHHPDGRRKGLVVVGRDITERKRAEERLQHLAHFDPLTQLPNRMLLTDRLQVATARAQRSGKLLAVCYLDLDNFKPINDSHGHEVGDHLLVEVARRLTEALRAGDSVGRLGGDEFVLLLGELGDEEECRIALDRVLQALALPYEIDDLGLILSASIGVTLYPSDAMDSDTLLRHADQAMYEAKEAGRNRYHFFDPERDQRMRSTREAHARIRRGLRDGEMTLHYQPKVNMRRGTVYGAEALIRWQHPQRGLLPPIDFLPQIADTEIAAEIDLWVLEQAIAQAAEWSAAGQALSISVNVSAPTLGRADFQQQLSGLLKRYPELPAHTLEIEILESVALDDVGRISAIIDGCRQLGIGFALDDFGTGYSSLLYLRHLPAGVLKIDQSFVRDMLVDPDDLSIVEGIVRLAEAFQREVIAEGVESDEHGALLLKLGCELGQGYGIARPMPAGALTGWLRGYRQPAPWAEFRDLRGAHPDAPLQLMAIEHRRWVHHLVTMIETGNAQEMTRSGLDLHTRECRFGRWYYGPGQHRFGHLAVFQDLEDTHARVHHLANELIELCLGGHQATARARKPELMAGQAQLLAGLDRLHGL